MRRRRLLRWRRSRHWSGQQRNLSEQQGPGRLRRGACCRLERGSLAKGRQQRRRPAPLRRGSGEGAGEPRKEEECHR